MSILEEGGVEFWACSGASAERVQHYFELAGIPFDARRIWEDSTLGVQKPNRKVYEALKEDMEKRAPGQVVIFVGRCSALIVELRADRGKHPTPGISRAQSRAVSTRRTLQSTRCTGVKRCGANRISWRAIWSPWQRLWLQSSANQPEPRWEFYCGFRLEKVSRERRCGVSLVRR
jgi:hypothetical protein